MRRDKATTAQATTTATGEGGVATGAEQKPESGSQHASKPKGHPRREARENRWPQLRVVEAEGQEDIEPKPQSERRTTQQEPRDNALSKRCRKRAIRKAKAMQAEEEDRGSTQTDQSEQKKAKPPSKPTTRTVTGMRSRGMSIPVNHRRRVPRSPRG